MSGGKCFEWIIVYSTLDIRVSKKKSFVSHDRNFAPLCASDIVIFNISFYFKRDAAGDAA